MFWCLTSLLRLMFLLAACCLLPVHVTGQIAMALMSLRLCLHSSLFIDAFSFLMLMASLRHLFLSTLSQSIYDTSMTSQSNQWQSWCQTETIEMLTKVSIQLCYRTVLWGINQLEQPNEKIVFAIQAPNKLSINLEPRIAAFDITITW